jgi:hypothetical protein
LFPPDFSCFYRLLGGKWKSNLRFSIGASAVERIIPPDDFAPGQVTRFGVGKRKSFAVRREALSRSWAGPMQVCLLDLLPYTGAAGMETCPTFDLFCDDFSTGVG